MVDIVAHYTIKKIPLEKSKFKSSGGSTTSVILNLKKNSLSSSGDFITNDSLGYCNTDISNDSTQLDCESISFQTDNDTNSDHLEDPNFEPKPKYLSERFATDFPSRETFSALKASGCKYEFSRPYVLPISNRSKKTTRLMVLDTIDEKYVNFWQSADGSSVKDGIMPDSKSYIAIKSGSIGFLMENHSDISLKCELYRCLRIIRDPFSNLSGSYVDEKFNLLKRKSLLDKCKVELISESSCFAAKDRIQFWSKHPESTIIEGNFGYIPAFIIVLRNWSQKCDIEFHISNTIEYDILSSNL